MEFVDFAIPEAISYMDMPWEEVVLVPVGDVHYGARGFAERSFHEYLSAVDSEYGDRAYYIGMGDYVDPFRTTVRKAFKNLSPDDGEWVDDHMHDMVQEFYDLVAHTKGRWLGMLRGNHSWDYREGYSVESELCEMLGTVNLNDCADIQLKFSSSDKTRGSVGVWVHHGVGGRKYPVGKLIDDVCPHFPDNDVFLMGHTHIREFRDFVKMRRVGKQYVHRTSIAAITGGWLKGYIEGPSSYVERRALKPLAVGGLVVKIRPRVVHGVWTPRLRVETI